MYTNEAVASLGTPAPNKPPLAPTLLGPGMRIHHYELIRQLGSGGMGTVFLARDTRLGRRVAITFLLAEQRELIDGFLREARAAMAHAAGVGQAADSAAPVVSRKLPDHDTSLQPVA